jgi:hypothetical protein
MEKKLHFLPVFRQELITTMNTMKREDLVDQEVAAEVEEGDGAEDVAAVEDEDAEKFTEKTKASRAGLLIFYGPHEEEKKSPWIIPNGRLHKLGNK